MVNECSCKSGFANLISNSGSIQVCNASCETTSTTYDNNLNSCSCKEGYDTKTLQGTNFMCNIKCETKSTTLNQVLNTCSCQ